jgi:excisionase family DNA binding protein
MHDSQPSEEDMDNHERLTFTVEEAARKIGISRAKAYECVRSGEIPSVRIGRRLVVPRLALDRLLDVAPRSHTDR